MNDQNHKTLKLYQERLVANKTRAKAGEVTIGKHVETETAQSFCTRRKRTGSN